MEFYFIYNGMVQMWSMAFRCDAPTAFLRSAIGASIVWLALFILQGIGLSTMAKARNIKNKWLAFLPFVSTLFMGKLAGECQAFGQKMKRAGLYTMIAQIVATVLCLLSLAAEAYLFIVCGEPEVSETLVMYWTGLTGFAAAVESAYRISNLILPIFQLVYQILMLFLLMGLFKKYQPKHYMTWGFLSLFIPASRFVVVFALRNRTAIDYEAYMQARRDAYFRQQQQYRNPYGGYNPYGTPYGNPYASPQKPKPEEPFEEFSSTQTEGTHSQESTGESGDDFFN